MSLNKKIYGNMYSQIDMNTMPGEMRLRGKTVAQQAKSVDYEDIPRDIQAMREAEYNKEVKEGEFVPEFSGARFGAYPRQVMPQRHSLGDYLGDAAKKTAPGLLLAGALLAVYWMFFREEGPKPEVVEEDLIVESPILNPDHDNDLDLDDDFLD